MTQPERPRKPPIRFSLEEYRIIESMFNETPEEDLTEDEIQIRDKVRQICRNIERSIARKKRETTDGRSNSQNQV